MEYQQWKKDSPAGQAGEAPDNMELLRQILSSEQNREVSYEEATEIGESLITFFEALAGAI
jgi:hypothetical protein